jgi:Domain of unknown function (DUF4190)/Domain of unknown function (DUF4333)
MATTSLVLGICSILFPLLAIPGFILGIASLRRIKRLPSLSGRGRSIAGIVTSLVLGSLGFVAIAAFITGGNNQLSMSRVQSTVRSLLQTDVQQQTGIKPRVQVYCPSSEPRRNGTEFTCTVDVANPNEQYSTEVREVDSRGDFIVAGPQQTQRSAGPTGSSGNSATAPPSTPLSLPPPKSVQLTGTPTNGEEAVISIDAAGHQLTLETESANVSYPTCTQLQIQSPGGAPASLSELTPGSFATVEIDANVPCISQIKVLTAPTPPQCSSSGLSGSADVTWEGFNQNAHSVLYKPSGPGESVVADRWCGAPTVVGPDHSATTLSEIPIGAQVQLLTSTNNGWVTGITEIS